MEKKNPYVTTIGFNKGDPDHIRAVEILNKMGRGKASYIAKAVLAYEAIRESGELPQMGYGTSMDYESLRSFVLKVIAEHEEKMQNPVCMKKEQESEPVRDLEESLTEQMGIDESAIQDILLSMEAFRG